MTSMATGRTRRRIAGSPSALALAGALLALAAFGQAIAQGLSHTVNATDVGGSAPYTVALGLLALAGTVPLIFLRPVAAAVAITAASARVLVAFGTPTVAGLIAQVIASYRLGWTAGFGRAGPAGDAGGAGRAAEAATSGGGHWSSPRWRRRCWCSRWLSTAARRRCCSPRPPRSRSAPRSRGGRGPRRRGRARPGRCWPTR